MVERLEADGVRVDDVTAPDGSLIRDGSVEAALPASVTLESVKCAVESSKTLHQIRRQLGLELQETRDLLHRPNLLDVVTGRPANRSGDGPTADGIDERIHAVTAD